MKLTSFTGCRAKRRISNTNLRPASSITAVEISGVRVRRQFHLSKNTGSRELCLRPGLRCGSTRCRPGRQGAGRAARAGGVAHKPWRAFRAEEALRGAGADEGAFSAAADRELQDAHGLRDNAFKIELAKRVIVATLSERHAWRLSRTGGMGHDYAIATLHKKGASGPRTPGGAGYARESCRPTSGASRRPSKVRVQARFAAEVPFKNLTYAALVCSTIAKGSITSMDTADAKAAPGVLLILTHENAAKLGALTPFPQGGALDTWAPLQDAQVRWNGQPDCARACGNARAGDVCGNADSSDVSAGRSRSGLRLRHRKGKVPRECDGSADAHRDRRRAESAFRVGGADRQHRIRRRDTTMRRWSFTVRRSPGKATPLILARFDAVDRDHPERTGHHARHCS